MVPVSVVGIVLVVEVYEVVVEIVIVLVVIVEIVLIIVEIIFLVVEIVIVVIVIVEIEIVVQVIVIFEFLVQDLVFRSFTASRTRCGVTLALLCFPHPRVAGVLHASLRRLERVQHKISVLRS